MNVHKNARLTVFGRERLVKQVWERVLTPAAAAAAARVSLRTVYKLLTCYKKEGPCHCLEWRSLFSTCRLENELGESTASYL
jgi:hypothetical protein